MCGLSSREHLRTARQGRGAWVACPGHFGVRSPRASGCCSKMPNPYCGNCRMPFFLTRSRRSLRRAGFARTAMAVRAIHDYRPRVLDTFLVGSMSKRYAFAAAPATPSLMSPSVDRSRRWHTFFRTGRHLNCSAFRLNLGRGIRLERPRISWKQFCHVQSKQTPRSEIASARPPRKSSTVSMWNRPSRQQVRAQLR